MAEYHRVIGIDLGTTFSFVAAYIIGTLVDRAMGFRVSEEDEITGVDLTIHAETAYELGAVTGSGYRAGSLSTTKEKVQA